MIAYIIKIQMSHMRKAEPMIRLEDEHGYHIGYYKDEKDMQRDGIDLRRITSIRRGDTEVGPPCL